ncbi:undecaprenyl diphosphate synthase [Allopseudospirillum japonicum]|uniref:Ditrans,polycis-undecaprenyl-diphosphate synthase ((2E,6E)-farnesyl-diphosphate specific) n=2 Tax=Allopseudospirillum japonicum TaxID=64971 RepID=A0A1H6R9L4_9GAMM|nr:polyprenyl diphosphate synthase [Allopseudospirillum japonicum]SEI51166.1 undecaprenyl diphosphate synthase [Allopseudospirillum japonicum]
MSDSRALSSASFSSTDTGSYNLLVPKHVAIIMDGNNRWAKARKSPGIAGHQAGVKSVRAVVEAALQQGVQVLTLFAFSSENWQRPKKEVSALMELFLLALRREVKRLHKHHIRLHVIGERSAFSSEIQQAIQEAEHLTATNQDLHLVIAANYGGRWDIAQAARQLAQAAVDGQIQAQHIQAQDFAPYLSLSQFPEPDLCIRTGGEQRISNFLLWQFAYTEFYFSPLFWPDFDQAAFHAAIADYQQRQRRFGRTCEQVVSPDEQTHGS